MVTTERKRALELNEAVLPPPVIVWLVFDSLGTGEVVGTIDFSSGVVFWAGTWLVFSAGGGAWEVLGSDRAGGGASTSAATSADYNNQGLIIN